MSGVWKLAHPGAAFLDRDGTINVKPPPGDYVTRADDLVLISGAADAIRALNDSGCKVIVVTNQRGIALGRMTEADLARVHRRMARLLGQAAEAHVDAFLHCPHGDGCDCRKPRPGLLLQAAERFRSIELHTSVIIGDTQSDVAAGQAAGTHTLLLGRDVPDLASAVAQILPTEFRDSERS